MDKDEQQIKSLSYAALLCGFNFASRLKRTMDEEEHRIKKPFLNLRFICVALWFKFRVLD